MVINCGDFVFTSDLALLIIIVNNCYNLTLIAARFNIKQLIHNG